MKKKKIIISVLAILTIGILIYSIYIIRYYFFYDDYKTVLSSMKYEYETGKKYTPLKEGKQRMPGMELVAENQILKLYLNPITSEIAVYDKRNNETVYSNPINRDEDPLAIGVNKDALSSQLIIDYYNANRYKVTMDNYKFSIANEQFSIESINNGVRIIYTIGSLSNPTGNVPIYITEQRLNTLVLEKVTKEQAKTVRSKYMESTTKKGFLELTAGTLKSKITLNKVIQIFDDAGYTEDDYKEEMLAANGVEADTISFTIPLEYRLEADKLVVSIPTGQIKESGGGKLASIQVLKFFGASGVSEKGYMLIPNGSGSLIHFNNNSKSENYSQYIYGTDPAAAGYLVLEDTQKARLPVYGIKREESAVFTMIKNGESFATISADVSGKINSYNYVFPTFTLRQTELLSMFGSTGGDADLPIVEDQLYDTNIVIEYAFLDKENADYSGMANYYREELVKAKYLTKKEKTDSIPFYLDIVGGVQKKMFMAGIPYYKPYPMTTFEQARAIVNKLAEASVTNVRLNYMGWFNGGVYHDMPEEINILSQLGSRKELEDLSQFVEDNGGKVYGDVAFQNISREAKGYSELFETSKYNSGIIVSLGRVNPATLRQTSSLGYPETEYNIISPKYLGEYVKSFSKDIMNIEDIGVGLKDLGDSLQSDKKRSAPIHREEAKSLVKHAFDILAGTGKDILVKGGDAYALAYADDLTNVPTKHNNYFIVDKQVPFYEMVIHGYINYSGESINLYNYKDADLAVLEMIEVGASPHFTFSYQPSSDIKYTGLNTFYSTNYEYWIEDAIQIYSRVNEALKLVTGNAMIRHEVLENQIVKTTYDNGVILYINPNNYKVNINGISINAKSWSKGEVEG